jgi:hypothetical protein
MMIQITSDYIPQKDPVSKKNSMDDDGGVFIQKDPNVPMFLSDYIPPKGS